MEAQKTFLGVDLGATKTALALVDAEGRVLGRRRLPTLPQEGADAVVARIARGAQGLLRGTCVAGVGVGVAGQVRRETGELLFAPNLKWHRVPLARLFREALGLPVAVTNDVRAATWAEWLYGAGRGTTDMVCLLVGTGIGGGVVAGGRLLEGCTNTAGELGHLVIVAGGRRCGCGGRGCLEAYASGWALAQRAREAVGADPAAGRAMVRLAGSPQAITAEVVCQAARQGDPLALQLVEETLAYLSAGVVGVVHAFNPCLIVIGGGVAQGIPHLAPRLEERVRAQALHLATASLRIVPWALGEWAGAIGAAAFARQALA